MIRKLFNQPHVLHQTGNHDVQEQEAICFSSWDSGLISITQEEDEILINPESVPELCRLLKKLAEGKS